MHGRAVYVYSIRWYNRSMPLPETWVHATGFSVDTHPMDPMDDLAVLHLDHMYIGHDESGVISIKTDCVNCHEAKDLAASASTRRIASPPGLIPAALL